jgi:hypothetical protein
LLADFERIAIAVMGSLEGKMKLGCPDMKDAESRQFHHRVNADRTIDSICLLCFLTAAKAGNKADLHELQAAHQCAGMDRLTLMENLRSLRRRR